jgi:hypothetical protein
MKKLLIIVAALILVQTSYSQNLQKDYIAHVDSSGLYLQKASSNIIISTVSVGLSAASFYWAAKTINDDPEESGALQYAIAGGFACVGLISYISYIVNLNKSGKHLHKAKLSYEKQQNLSWSFQTNQNGVGIALNF